MIVHPPCSIPTIFMNNGFRKLEALCTVLEYTNNEQLHKVFMSNNLLSTVDFMAEMKSMITGKDLSDDIKCYYYYHNLLNHISLSNLHVLAKKGKVLLRLLNVKSTPPCTSCLFGRVHRKPQRSKGSPGSIRKDNCKPGDECSVNQIVISLPGIVPQSIGRLTKQRYIGSQVTIDHITNYCHIAYLEEFTMTETI